jgi:hypothetical protein
MAAESLKRDREWHTGHKSPGNDKTLSGVDTALKDEEKKNKKPLPVIVWRNSLQEFKNLLAQAHSSPRRSAMCVRVYVRPSVMSQFINSYDIDKFYLKNI